MAENEKNKAEELEEQEEITVSDLNKEIEKLKKENEKYYEHLQRTAAEFDNYKKRVMKEKEKISEILCLAHAKTQFTGCQTRQKRV